MEGSIIILVVGIIFLIAGIAIPVISPHRVINEVVNKVEHEYKTSTDYEHLYDLLMDGRKVILIRGDGTVSVGEVAKYRNGTEVVFYGFGFDTYNMLKNCDKAKFIHFCTFTELTYLDQTDKYYTLQDYMKK